MSQILSRDQTLQRLENIEDLPSLPLVITKLTQVIQSVDSSANDVATVMEEDPAIMARVLKLVNSSFYSNISGEPITNVKHAIVRLGYDAVRNIALTTSVFTVFKEDHQKVFDRKEFWKYCICTGLIANTLYEMSDLSSEIIPKDSVTLAGLMHDIGKIILEQYFYDEFSKILEESHKYDTPLLDVEKKMIGMTHTEIGAWLAKKWKLNHELVACIEFYPTPELAPKEYQPLVNLVHLSDYITNFKPLGQSGNPSPPPCSERVWTDLGLDPHQMTDILDKAEDAAERSQILLSLG
jgi:putative nucleotidyltransferase with HDIG domain